MKKILIPMLLTVLWSCTERQPESILPAGAAFYTIPFEEAIKNDRTVLLSELAGEISYTPLETSESCMLGSILSIKTSRDYLFIRHNGSPLISQFRRDGSFVRHIGRAGRGPEEYELSRCFSLDREKEHIYIFTNWTRKILVYDFDGRYIRTIRFEGMNHTKIHRVRDSTLVLFSEPRAGIEKLVFAEVNEQGDTLQGVPNYTFWNINGPFQRVVGYWYRNVFYRYDGVLHMKGEYNDTVYTYNNNQRIIPKYYIDLGTRRLPDEYRYERWPQEEVDYTRYYWVAPYESNRYILLRFSTYATVNNPDGIGDEGFAVYDKSTGQIVRHAGTKEQTGFPDDLGYGPPVSLLYADDSTLFDCITALDFKQYFEGDRWKNLDTEQQNRLRELKIKLLEDDNPVLVEVHLKN